jgi:hypothetical protein
MARRYSSCSSRSGVNLRRSPRSCSLDLRNGIFPGPRQQFRQPCDFDVEDSGDDGCEPRLGIDIVRFCHPDHGIHTGCALPTTPGFLIRPRLPAQSDPTQGAFGGIVCHAQWPSLRKRVMPGQWPGDSRWLCWQPSACMAPRQICLANCLPGSERYHRAASATWRNKDGAPVDRCPR